MPLDVCVNGSRAWLNSQTQMWNFIYLFFVKFRKASCRLFFFILFLYCLGILLCFVCAQMNVWPLARAGVVTWFVMMRLMTLKLDVSDEKMYAKITIDCTKSLCDAKKKKKQLWSAGVFFFLQHSCFRTSLFFLCRHDIVPLNRVRFGKIKV